MDINSYTTHRIYPQYTDFSFQVDLSLTTRTGILNFGFSGDSVVNFSAISGRLIDHQGNYFGTYSENIPFSISGNASTGTVDYFLNSYPFGLGIPKATGVINSFYIDPTATAGSFDLYVQGTPGSFTVTESLSYDTGNSVLPITLTNTSLPFYIFSGQFLGDTSKFSFSGFPTGLFSGSRQFYFLQSGIPGLSTLNMYVYTDYGTQSLNVVTSGVDNFSTTPIFELTGPSVVNTANPSVFYCYFSNPTGTLTIIPTLSYLSGSGNSYTPILATGYYSGTVTGLIVNSGYLTYPFQISGSGIGGANNTFTTGLFTFLSPTLQFATGLLSGAYNVMATGIGSVGAYTGPATGYISGIITGLIGSGTGIYHANQFVEGVPTPAYSLGPTGLIYPTGAIIYNTPVANDFLYINNPNLAIVNGFNYTDINTLNTYINTHQSLHFATGNIVGGQIKLTSLIGGANGNTGLLNTDNGNIGSMTTLPWAGGQSLGQGSMVTPTQAFSGWLSQDYSGSGIYSQSVSGQGTGYINAFDFSKNFTGTWDIQTGLFTNSLTDFLASEYINTTHDMYIGQPINKQAGAFYIYVSYTNPYGGNDFATLTVSGLEIQSGISVTLSGVL